MRFEPASSCRTGAPSPSAWRASTSAASGSYSTSTSSDASRARSRVSATTATPTAASAAPGPRPDPPRSWSSRSSPRRLHGLEDVPVAGAAADVALKRLPDLLLRGARVGSEQGSRAHQHSRCAVAALEGVMVAEGLLQRRQLPVLAQALDRLDRGAVGLDGQQHAALHELPVHDHRARAAVARVAADVAAGQVEVVADEVDEQLARLDFAFVLDAVARD